MRLLAPLLALSLAAAAMTSPATAAPVPLTIDVDHSNVGFSVRHLYVRVQGRFKSFEGTIAYDESHPEASTVQATIRAASIDTNLEARDKDLRSPRFFDADKFPTLTFSSASVTKTDGAKLTVAGTLTMHGVSKDVPLDVEFLGKGKDPWGNVRYAFRATTTVNRKDFGMRWNEALETGGILVGDDVEITLDIDAIAKS